jgi:hypothetical protein
MADEKNINNTNYPVAPSQPLTERDLKTLAQRKEQRAPAEKPGQKLPPGKKPPIKLEEAKKLAKEKRVRPLLRYYNTELLIPVSRGQIIPGNCYVFSYSAYKHVPTPILFYVGTNPRYNTMEGISLQYLSTGERKRLFQFFRKTELHSEKMLKGSQRIRSLMGEYRHIFRRSFTSDSIYNFMKKKMSDKILFYRRYKFPKISSRIYVVPIEALERALEVNTPVKPINPLKLEESKRKFGSIINKMSQNRH